MTEPSISRAPARYKIFADPVHGFISVPREVILDLIHTAEVQRLRRIRQLGVGYLVFPGAEHTRFGHAIGAMALMHDALQTLREKGTEISQLETAGAQCAALLHDVGHGPFSHTLEHELITDFRHELMSRAVIARMAERFGGPLDLALDIFDDRYTRRFFHQLVSSQLDMDRLDYLRRDSFYTGVVEGAIGVQRIIRTMRVHPLDGGTDASIVIDAKGTYAVESFLIARRLMYWQVYLHKTVVAGDELLRSIIRRVRTLLRSGAEHVADLGSPAFTFFLSKELSAADLARDDVVDMYCDLDDTDVLYSIKQWSRTDDPVLRDLCARFITRDFFRVVFLDKPPTSDQVDDWRMAVSDWLAASGLCAPSQASVVADYYLAAGSTTHSPYEAIEDSIRVMDRQGVVRELSEIEDTTAVGAMRRFEVKPYVCYPKSVQLNLAANATNHNESR